MKDKDPNDDELNKDEQDNINEADDSFGLPDLEFNTLDEESEEEPADSNTENVEETADSSEEEPQAEVSEPYDEEEPEVEEATLARPSYSYVPPKPESNAPKIIGVLIAILLVAAAIWYFGFYRPEVAAEKARIERTAKLKADNAAKAAAKKKQEEERLTAEQEVNQAADEDEIASEEALFSTISEPTGRYYIVIESFVDSDMATDYGKELMTKGFSTALLSPQGKRKFHRLTMGDFDSFVDAQEGANKLKAEFGDDLWVLRY
jgi:hypothetical protein